MNSAVGPIFNKNFVEKRGLWVPWIVYGTHWNSHHNHKMLKKKKKKRGTQTRPFSSVPKRVLNFLSRGMSRLILKWKKNRLENRELVKCVTNCCKFLLVTSMCMPHLMPVTIYKQVLLVNYFNCKVRLVTLF